MFYVFHVQGMNEYTVQKIHSYLKPDSRIYFKWRNVETQIHLDTKYYTNV
jgi:hypothetical protein